MIRNLNSGPKQLGDGSHDALFVQIAFWIVISAHHQDSSMVPGAYHEEIVQVFEIMMIMREKSAILSDGLGQVHRVIVADHADIGRKPNVVAGLSQQAG